MTLIFLICLFVCLAPALAQVPDLGKPPPSIPIAPEQYRAASGFKPRAPLVLPDIPAERWKLLKAHRDVALKQALASRKVLAFWEGHGKWLRATRKTKCWEVPWQRSCTIARASYRLHTTLLETAGWKLWHELPLTNDWQTAVRIAQRVYPGTSDWMLSISDREGGWGPWVWWGGSCGSPPCLWHGYHIGADSTGDTVGGWMQFRWSTFAPYWRAAQQDVRKRGFVIPEFPNRGGDAIWQPWLDPLGQALTAGYMRFHGRDGCHWCL